MEENKRVRKLYDHYRYVDRAYGRHPIYRFNDTFYLFGTEANIILGRFYEWSPNGAEKLEWHLHQCGNILYLTFNIGSIWSLRPFLNFHIINMEEVHYGAFLRPSAYKGWMQKYSNTQTNN